MSAIESQSQSQAPTPAKEVSVGTAKTKQELPGGILLRSIGLSFEKCTAHGTDLCDLIEEVFEYVFEELHGIYDGLNLDKNAIYRYEFRSSALTVDKYFGFQAPEFKQATCRDMIKKMMNIFDCDQFFNLFRSVMIVNLTYTPR
uniref:Uncharacterized protein n=1 Tax=Panagrolaimus superbus TaxID=310955 RepID=A0A914YTE9_9BILA